MKGPCTSFGSCPRSLGFRDCGPRVRHGTACCRQAAISQAHVPSRFGAKDVDKHARYTLDPADRSHLRDPCLQETVSTSPTRSSRLPHSMTVADPKRMTCRLVFSVFVFLLGRQDEGAVTDARRPGYREQGPSYILQVREESQKACLDQMGPACVQWLSTLSRFVKGPPRHGPYLARHQAPPTDVALYAP